MQKILVSLPGEDLGLGLSTDLVPAAARPMQAVEAR
jgi:hypothetical protein